jgi:hypothetical protein
MGKDDSKSKLFFDTPETAVKELSVNTPETTVKELSVNTPETTVKELSVNTPETAGEELSVDTPAMGSRSKQLPPSCRQLVCSGPGKHHKHKTPARGSGHFQTLCLHCLHDIGNGKVPGKRFLLKSRSTSNCTVTNMSHVMQMRRSMSVCGPTCTLFQEKLSRHVGQQMLQLKRRGEPT